ncbi:hypothetical protein [Kitasatospora sp. NPDC057223]|uniref:hypothetical protein n=1 Tax=Kitasatospora sp. NPDC057223 TaxID=3346055 RepID=UPI00362D7290
MTVVPIPRRGLFATDPDQRLRPGTPTAEWELWLTGPNNLVPMPDLATALVSAAEHNALTVDLDDGSPLQPVTYAIVLHRGYAWRREGAARAGARVAVPSLCWTACCSVCGELVEDEYIPHHTSPEAAAEEAVAGREWVELPDGRLVCECDDDVHDDARAQAASDNDGVPDEDQLTFP